MTRLPPLNSLKAFDAASRQLSFTKAAEELFVTHGAVSRQIAQLESFLELKLFERNPRGLTLTKSGEIFASDIQSTFKQLIGAVDRVSSIQRRTIVTISTVSSLAARWLVPRLNVHQDLDIHISTSRRPVDLNRENVDIAIRHGGESYKGYESRILFRPTLFPACSPALIEAGKPISSIVALMDHEFFHDESFGSWEFWFQQNGLPGVQIRRGTVVEDLNVVIQAGILGKGVILVPTQFIEEEIRLGLLMHPFSRNGDLKPVQAPPYRVLVSRERELKPEARFIYDWLYEEAAPLRNSREGNGAAIK